MGPEIDVVRGARGSDAAHVATAVRLHLAGVASLLDAVSPEADPITGDAAAERVLETLVGSAADVTAAVVASSDGTVLAEVSSDGADPVPRLRSWVASVPDEGTRHVALAPGSRRDDPRFVGGAPVRRLGATLPFADTPGGGTTVEVRFPPPTPTGPTAPADAPLADRCEVSRAGSER